MRCKWFNVHPASNCNYENLQRIISPSTLSFSMTGIDRGELKSKKTNWIWLFFPTCTYICVFEKSICILLHLRDEIHLKKKKTRNNYRKNTVYFNLPLTLQKLLKQRTSASSRFVSGSRQLLALSPLTLEKRRQLWALVNKTSEQIEVYRISLSSNQKSSRRRRQ